VSLTADIHSHLLRSTEHDAANAAAALIPPRAQEATMTGASKKVQAAREAWAQVMSGERCSRCHRLAPPQDSDAFVEWEALDETGVQVVCPDCLTGAEETAMAEDFARTLHAQGGEDKEEAAPANSGNGL
jgi:hypothetical protein